MFAASFFLSFGTLIQTARLENVFDNWDDAQKGMTSLVIEFDYERDELIRRRKHQGKGTFCLQRGKDGHWSASHTVVFAETGQRFDGLMLDRKIYWLESDAKTAWVFTPDDPQRFLARNVFPPTILLDRERAESALKIGVEKQDQYYTYVSIESKPPRWKPAYFDTPFRGVVAVLNVDTPEIPKNIPCVIQYTEDAGQVVFRYDIRKWQINPKDGVDATKFVQPEDREGWVVRPRPSIIMMALMPPQPDPTETPQQRKIRELMERKIRELFENYD